MSFIYADRVKETTTTTGTGTLSLGGTSTGYQTFVNGIGNGNTCVYLIDDGNGNWEVTSGVITSGSPATITRGTLVSSSTGSRISFSAGTKTVTVVPCAEQLLWPANNASLVETSIASATTTDLGSSITFRVTITGTTTITGFGSQPNAIRFVRFSGALTLTHNATSLILLGGVSRLTVAGDLGLYISDGSGNWREMFYNRAAAARFLAYKSSTATNQTGNGANPTVSFGSEQFDDGSNFASDTFTAPITGRYRLSGRVYVSVMSTAMTNQQIALVTSNRTYTKPQDITPITSGSMSLDITDCCDMDAGDTAIIKVQLSNGAGNTASFFGDATTMYTTFSGEFVG